MKTFNDIAIFWNNFFLIKVYFNWLHKKIISFLKEKINFNLINKILDIGCATGNFLIKINKIYPSIKLYGIDESSKMIELAIKKNPQINYLSERIEETTLPQNNFDLITIIESFHHFQKQEFALKKTAELLKTNGFLFICEPDLNNLFIKTGLKILKLFPIEKESKFHTENQLISLGNKYNLTLIHHKKILGNIFLLFKKSK